MNNSGSIKIEQDKTVNDEVCIPCIDCDNLTHHKVIKSVNRIDNTEDGYYWSDYEILMCQGCKTISFRHAFGSDDIIGESRSGELLYEKFEELFPGRINGRKQLPQYYYLPGNILRIYRETHKALCEQQPILAGIGIRALVEAVSKEKNAKGRDLKDKIDNLVIMGVLTTEGAQILHKARNFGNEAAHEVLLLKNEDLGVLMDIAENLLVNTYILPKKAAELKERTKKN